MKRWLALLALLSSALLVDARPVVFPPPPGAVVGTSSPCADTQFLKTNGTVWECAADPGAGTGAPTDAQYWTGAADGTLSAEKNLGALGTALVINTAGVPSAYTGATCTNQFPRIFSPVGAPTCASVALTDLNFTPALSTDLTTHTSATSSVHGISNTASLLLKDGSVVANFLALLGTGANRRLSLTAGDLLRVTNTSSTEGRYISNASLEQVDAAAIATSAVTKPKLVLGTDAGDANTLTLHDLISGAPGTDECVQWDGAAWVPGTCGAGFSGDASDVPFTPVGAIAATNVQTAIEELDTEKIATTARGAANGVAALDSGTKLTWSVKDRIYTHADLSAATTIDAVTAAASVIEIQNAGAGNVTLSSNPQMNGCTSGNNGVVIELRGLSATKTVTLINGAGLLLPGNTGTVVVGIAPGGVSAQFRCRGSSTTWERINVPGLNAASTVDRVITGAVDTSTAVCVGQDASNCTRFYFASGENHTESVVGGSVSANTSFNVGAGGEFNVYNSSAASVLKHDNDTGLTTIKGAPIVMPFVVETPAVGDSGKFKIEWPQAVTLKEISCYTDAGTVDINIEERARATHGSSGTAALSADLTCDSDGTTTTTFSDSAQAAKVPVALTISDVTGAGFLYVYVHAWRN